MFHPKCEFSINVPRPSFVHFTISYTFYGLGMSDMKKVRKAVFMFTDLFGLERYDYNKLVRAKTAEL